MKEIATCKLLFEFVGAMMVDDKLERDSTKWKAMTQDHGGYIEIKLAFVPLCCQWASEALEAITAVFFESLLNKRNITGTWTALNYRYGTSFNDARCGRRYYHTHIRFELRKRRLKIWWAMMKLVEEYCRDHPGQHPTRNHPKIKQWIKNIREHKSECYEGYDSDQLAALKRIDAFGAYVRIGKHPILKSWHNKTASATTLCITYKTRYVTPGGRSGACLCIVKSCQSTLKHSNGMCKGCYHMFEAGAIYKLEVEDGMELSHESLLKPVKQQRADNAKHGQVLIITNEVRRLANGRIQCHVVDCIQKKFGARYCRQHNTKIEVNHTRTQVMETEL